MNAADHRQAAQDLLQTHTRRTGFFAYLRRGPWGRAVGGRLAAALHELVERLADLPHLAAIAVFGSYARAEAGASSDLACFQQ